ncbi:phosphonate ABC transporter, periplasmic phosphonate-binding protein (plasmid) [Haloterrigena turkmenica DSM 5511]|uniref:Phosphonate ABC transporter, periplasmic phosphonate-binding protein n=2 Tax=Haloterrigena turkmenica TaxID=62320 RepID=D2S078_HALTV|nr:phosphonate ABC transporter, periplasmic phosphonate-binding protein [Haloterrigena turkmenica DSM 5511]
MTVNRTRRAFLGVAGIGLAGGCLQNGRRSTSLTMGVIPDVDPDTAIEQNTELAEYIESELNASVDLRTTTDYAGLIQAMTAGQVDLAYYGGVSYILAHHRANAKPIVVGSKDGSTDWHSVFIAHESTGISSVDDLKRNAGELDIVFGDPLSTSGTVMPTYYLRQRHDLYPERAFQSHTHVGAHDAVMETVAGRNSDVGALNARIYERIVEDQSVEGSISEIWRTPGFADYPWAVSTALDEETVSSLRDAFTSLAEEGREDILAQQNVNEYVSIRHEDFEELDDAVEMMGLRSDGDE